FLLTIGPASRKPYATYRNFLKAHHAKPAEVVTKLDYADNTFAFSFEMWADSPRVQEMVKKVYATDEAKMVVSAFDRLKALPAPHSPAQGDFTATSFTGPQPDTFERRTQAADLPPKRRGRPPKTEQAPPVPASFADQSTPPPSAPAPKNNGGATDHVGIPPEGSRPISGFGMQTPEPVSADMQRRLDEAFGR